MHRKHQGVKKLGKGGEQNIHMFVQVHVHHNIHHICHAHQCHHHHHHQSSWSRGKCWQIFPKPFHHFQPPFRFIPQHLHREIIVELTHPQQLIPKPFTCPTNGIWISLTNTGSCVRRYPLINGPNNENIRFCLRKDLNSSWVWRAILWRMEFEESSISQSFEDQCVCLNSSNCILFCSLCDWNLLLVACLHKELIIHQANIKATHFGNGKHMWWPSRPSEHVQHTRSPWSHIQLCIKYQSWCNLIFSGCISAGLYKFHFMPLALHPKIVGLCFLDGKPKDKNFHVIPVAAG